jgi:gluconokinase
MLVILTGVAGSGKTTIGSRLAGELGWRFLDADDVAAAPAADPRGAALAPPAPATTGETAFGPLRAHIEALAARGDSAVLACTALTARHRQSLNVSSSVRFVYLKGSAALIRRRLRNRSGHFLRDGVLAEQLAAVEEPSDALTIDIEDRPGRIVERIRAALDI